MNTILGVVSAFVAICVFMVATYRRGFRKGQLDSYEAGYLRGRKDADNWWIGIESEADQVRQKIWREEAHL